MVPPDALLLAAADDDPTEPDELEPQHAVEPPEDTCPVDPSSVDPDPGGPPVVTALPPQASTAQRAQRPNGKIPTRPAEVLALFIVVPPNGRPRPNLAHPEVDK